MARTDVFRTLAREIAMQVASMDPTTVGSMEEDDGEGLSSQEYIRDSRKTIRDLIKETIAQVRENIQVSRFMRFEVGTSGVGTTDEGVPLNKPHSKNEETTDGGRLTTTWFAVVRRLLSAFASRP